MSLVAAECLAAIMLKHKMATVLSCLQFLGTIFSTCIISCLHACLATLCKKQVHVHTYVYVFHDRPSCLHAKSKSINMHMGACSIVIGRWLVSFWASSHMPFAAQLYQLLLPIIWHTLHVKFAGGLTMTCSTLHFSSTFSYSHHGLFWSVLLLRKLGTAPLPAQPGPLLWNMAIGKPPINFGLRKSLESALRTNSLYGHIVATS